MKKFLSALIVVLTFALINVQNVSAADIPDIRLLNTERIKLTKKQIFNKGKELCYTFECLDKKGNKYLEQYINFLTHELNFTISKQEERRILFSKYKTWFLMYSGNENISPVITKKDQYHVFVSGHNKFIIVSVVNGINMINVQPSTKTQPDPVETVPAQNVPAANNGADVPDLEQFGGVVYSSHKQNSDKSVTYFFHAHNLSETALNDLTAKYIQLLTGSYNFVQTSYEDKKFERKRVQAVRKSEKWTFRYTGSKSAWSLSDGNHIHMRRIRNLQNGDTTFEIRVAYGLTFAGNYGAPSQGGNRQTTCSACGGSGKCSICGGRGYYSVSSDYEQPCGACLTSGKCSDCDGKGYR